MSQPLVLIDKQDGICRVTLNRPEALNALSSSLRNTLADILSDLSRDTETQVVILTGAGRAFTVGLDLKELGGELDDSNVRQASRSATRSRDLGQALKDLPQPVIGAINGFAITGGFELALMCDFLIASTEVRDPLINSRLLSTDYGVCG